MAPARVAWRPPGAARAGTANAPAQDGRMAALVRRLKGRLGAASSKPLRSADGGASLKRENTKTMIRKGDRALKERWRERFMALPPAAREALAEALSDLRTEALERAETSWCRHKGPMALYWKTVGVYAGHLRRALGTRSTRERREGRVTVHSIGGNVPDSCEAYPDIETAGAAALRKALGQPGTTIRIKDEDGNIEVRMRAVNARRTAPAVR